MESTKNRHFAGLIAVFFGIFGAHMFYLDRKKTGTAFLLFTLGSIFLASVHFLSDQRALLEEITKDILFLPCLVLFIVSAIQGLGCLSVTDDGFEQFVKKYLSPFYTLLLFLIAAASLVIAREQFPMIYLFTTYAATEILFHITPIAIMVVGVIVILAIPFLLYLWIENSFVAVATALTILAGYAAITVTVFLI